MILAALRGPIGRLIPVGIVLFALQVTIFSEIRPFGVAIQVLLAFAAAAGVAGGADRGMIVGFVFGLLIDLGTGSPLGSSSITYGLAALVASRATVVMVERPWWVSAIFVGIGAMAGELATPALRALIGEPTALGGWFLTVLAVVGIGAGLLSPLFVPLSGWCLKITKAPLRIPAGVE